MDAQQPILISPEEIDLVVENLLAEFGTVFGLGDIERLIGRLARPARRDSLGSSPRRRS